ncbi:ABC transporter substrate-binding protein [Pelagicoccus albus]|uniref:ABC transporter substrate-binding protein n=2 Tax=Pelagicoccus albus TaxID=415222 RepID=A0A7X1B969_9BACT|nr:ABC transporter substrate-binding protein [Pelagicoccus albus]MBC2607876.1 ABC transporter substrate-binding protein [Pelagicoccus albus]
MSKKAWILNTCLGVLLSGCANDRTDEVEAEADGQALRKVTLKLDWYAEPAHGGFYQALLNGYYEEAGLEVEIQQGGPGVMPLQAVALGRVDFTLGRIDDAIIGVDRGLPVQLVAAYMEKDPQAIMFHASNPIDSWEDLDGKSIMVNPGNAFVAVLRKRKQIDFSVIPLDYGIQRFLKDPDFIQQCFVTSQPYFAKQQGVEVGVMLLSDEDYSPERVVITNTTFAEENPEIVKAFAESSLRGWKDYMEGDPSKTHEYLTGIHNGNTDELNAYSHKAMSEYKVVFGDASLGESLGLIDESKLEKTIETLRDLEIVKQELRASDLIDYSILPEAVRVPVK